jgi:hypothetical protein
MLGIKRRELSGTGYCFPSLLPSARRWIPPTLTVWM